MPSRSTPEIKIRPMTQADKPAVMALLRDTTEFVSEDVAVAEEVIDCYLAGPERSGYFVLVAEMDGSIKGYISFGQATITRGTWDIYWLAVSPDRKGQGIGSALLARAESQITEASGRMILIETSSLPSYQNTRYFYAARGYREICRVADYYDVGDDKVLFRKLLRQIT